MKRVCGYAELVCKIICFAAVLTAGFAHAQSELTYKGGVLKDGTKLAPAKVREIMSGNSEALKMYNSGRALGTTGMIFGGVGGFLVGFDLETRLGGGEGNGTLLAVGGNCIKENLYICSINI